MKKISLSVIMLLTWCAAFATPPTNAVVTIYDGASPVIINPATAYSASLGPTYLDLNPNAPDTRVSMYQPPTTMLTAAQIALPVDAGVNPWEIGVAPGFDNDYWSCWGQVSYFPDDLSAVGLDRIQTYAYYNHVHALSPRITQGPEPYSSATVYDGAKWITQKHPICFVRNYAIVSNEALVVYESNALSCAGTKTSRGGDEWPLPWLQLPTDFVVTDIALSSFNEFAFVCGHNATTGKGQIAVVACEGRYIPGHTFPFIAFPNQGSWSALKLMGFIDLPFSNPDSIAAATNGFWQAGSTNGWVNGSLQGLDLGQIDITLANERFDMREGTEMGWQGIVAKGGYAIVSSRADGKAAILDLSPLMMWARHQYLDDDKQAATLAAWKAGAFPGILTTSNTPTIVWTHDFAGATCVLAGQRTDRWSQDHHKAYVAQASGLITIIDTSSLLNRWDFEPSGSLGIIGTVQVGANPVDMCFARFQEWPTPLIPAGGNADPLNNVFHVACRGSRSIDSVVTYGGAGIVYRSLTDTVLQDPVAVSVADRANIMTVGDHNGKQLVSYRIGGLRDHVTYGAWGVQGQLFMPGPANAPTSIERAGVLGLPGKPKRKGVASSNLN